MLLDISDQERRFLAELLDTKHTSLLHEINHTDTQDFRAILKQQLEILEELNAKIHHLGASKD